MLFKTQFSRHNTNNKRNSYSLKMYVALETWLRARVGVKSYAHLEIFNKQVRDPAKIPLEAPSLSGEHTRTS